MKFKANDLPYIIIDEYILKALENDFEEVDKYVFLLDCLHWQLTENDKGYNTDEDIKKENPFLPESISSKTFKSLMKGSNFSISYFVEKGFITREEGKYSYRLTNKVFKVFKNANILLKEKQ